MAPAIAASAENTDFQPTGSNFWLIWLVNRIEKIIRPQYRRHKAKLCSENW
jgi:hypothetical protein